MNINELVREAVSGSAAAQKCLFDLFADPMMTLCRRYVRRREDAEELLLDGFCKFFGSLPRFEYRGEAALRAWLKKIMIRECLMFLRRKNVFSLIADDEAPEIPVAAIGLDELSAEEIHALIVELPLGYRTVFNLHVIEGMEHKEIARELGIAEGTSKSQLSKAKALLQKMLIQKGIIYGRTNNR